jgi:hypothetical protein
VGRRRNIPQAPVPHLPMRAQHIEHLSVFYCSGKWVNPTCSSRGIFSFGKSAGFLDSYGSIIPSGPFTMYIFCSGWNAAYPTTIPFRRTEPL